MTEKQGSLLDRMKQLPLWQWGSICIFGGLFSGMAVELTIDASDMRRAEERAARLGSAVCVTLFLIAGITLIVLHFVRRKRK